MSANQASTFVPLCGLQAASVVDPCPQSRSRRPGHKQPPALPHSVQQRGKSRIGAGRSSGERSTLGGRCRRGHILPVVPRGSGGLVSGLQESRATVEAEGCELVVDTLRSLLRLSVLTRGVAEEVGPVLSSGLGLLSSRGLARGVTGVFSVAAAGSVVVVVSRLGVVVGVGSGVVVLVYSGVAVVGVARQRGCRRWNHHHRP